MIKYRIFGFELDRGVISVEYEEPGSGVTTTIDFMRWIKPGTPITPEALHTACVEARPKKAIENYRLMRSLQQSDRDTIQNMIGQERTISDDEEAAVPMSAKGIPVTDTSKM